MFPCITKTNYCYMRLERECEGESFPLPSRNTRPSYETAAYTGSTNAAVSTKVDLSEISQSFPKCPDGGPFFIVMLPRPIRRWTRRDEACPV
jgi:hypothetical protein